VLGVTKQITEWIYKCPGRVSEKETISDIILREELLFKATQAKYSSIVNKLFPCVEDITSENLHKLFITHGCAPDIVESLLGIKIKESIYAEFEQLKEKESKLSLSKVKKQIIQDEK